MKIFMGYEKAHDEPFPVEDRLKELKFLEATRKQRFLEQS